MAILMAAMFIGMIVMLTGIVMDVILEVSGGLPVSLFGCLVVVVALVVTSIEADEKRKVADKHFRSMYEIASPCRLVDVHSCADGECEVVIKCKDGE